MNITVQSILVAVVEPLFPVTVSVKLDTLNNHDLLFKGNFMSIATSHIDSLSIAFNIGLLDHIPNIEIIPIKDLGIRPKQEDLEEITKATDRSYNKYRRASRIFLIHDEYGQSYVAAEWNGSRDITIEFHALHQYDQSGLISESSLFRLRTMSNILSHIKKFKIRRVDYAIDMEKIPYDFLYILSTKRQAKLYKSTTYFEPLKQRGKENARLKVCLYDKAKKNSFPFPLERLEFSVKSPCWPKEMIDISNLESIIVKKGQNIIKRWTGSDVKINTAYIFAHTPVDATRTKN